MKRLGIFFVLALSILVRTDLCRADTAEDRVAALKTATSWLALLDKPDFVAAGAGVSEESLALIQNGTPDEKAHSMGAVLASIGPTSRVGGAHETRRTLESGGIRQVTS